MTVLDVDKIRPYPPRVAADPNISNKIHLLWNYGKKFQILSGPPGVGKTLAAEDFIYSRVEQFSGVFTVEQCRVSHLFPDFRTKIYSDTEIQQTLSRQNIEFVWELVVLHPQYTYEDLIRGYKVFSADSGSTLKVREGVLGFASRVVRILSDLVQNPQSINGVLVLDEINRAPIGQLFGEAIFALDRRNQEVTTPFELDGKGAKFSVPDSLLILGTMNSIDRATTGFDYALRRRFSNIAVSSSIRPIEAAWGSVPTPYTDLGAKLYKNIVEFLKGSEVTGTIPIEELTVGPAYFLPPLAVRSNGQESVRWLVASYLYQIIPTLLDYSEQGLLDYSNSDSSILPFADALQGHQAVFDLEETILEEEFLKHFGLVANESTHSN